MAQHKISWTEQTWNPLLGCTKVSAGCDNCYAIRQARMRASNPNAKIAEAFAGLVERNDADELDWTGRVNLLPARLGQPQNWRKPRRVFIPSESDLFHEQVPDDYIAQVFAVMAATPRHTYQVPTKRHGRMRSLLSSSTFGGLYEQALRDLTTLRVIGIRQAHDAAPPPLPNVWLGVSVENQKWADLRIPALLATPAARRWISAEPLLGPVNLSPLWIRNGTLPIAPLEQHVDQDTGAISRGIDWVVAGGESGPGSRPMHPDWARSLRDQCQAAGVAFHFKQHGDWVRSRVGGLRGSTVLERDGRMHSRLGEPLADIAARGGVIMDRVGKKAAGRELDGRVWDEYPPVVTAA